MKLKMNRSATEAANKMFATQRALATKKTSPKKLTPTPPKRTSPKKQTSPKRTSPKKITQKPKKYNCVCTKCEMV